MTGRDPIWKPNRCIHLLLRLPKMPPDSVTPYDNIGTTQVCTFVSPSCLRSSLEQNPKAGHWPGWGLSSPRWWWWQWHRGGWLPLGRANAPSNTLNEEKDTTPCGEKYWIERGQGRMREKKTASRGTQTHPSGLWPGLGGSWGSGWQT